MAAGVNYNNVWAALGTPVDVVKNRPKDPYFPDTSGFHIGGSDASGIVWKIGSEVTNLEVGDEVVLHCGQWSREDPVVKAGRDPMFGNSFRIWGYETSWGSFAQFTKAQAQQCLPKPKHLSWAAAASYMLVGATAYRMLRGWAPNQVKKDDVVLIWGGAGGLGTQAIQIARSFGARPIAVVSGAEKMPVLQGARRHRLHRPPQVRPLGPAARLARQRRLRRLAQEGARLRQGHLGDRGRGARTLRSSSSIPVRPPSPPPCWSARRAA